MRKVFYSKHHTVIQKKHKKFGGIFLIGIGIAVLFYFFSPLMLFRLYFSSSYALEAPLPNYGIIGNTLSSVFGQDIFNANLNDARNWYPSVQGTLKQAKIESYTLSIPKLGITDGVVSTIDYDLSSHLVQYFGTAMPGDNGTAVIFGHSTLPHLFDQHNYKTIFATLHLLKVGDEIDLTVKGVTYHYAINTISVTDPSDTSMFSQSYDTSNITLVTCTPPGTIWKRLIIKAKLQALKNNSI